MLESNFNKISSILFVLGVNLCCGTGITDGYHQSEYTGPTPMEYIEMYNYTGEEHQVLTEDGYRLTIYRILPKRIRNSSPIVLNHGLGSSCIQFLYTNRTSLGYFLAEAGLDVWLVNTRGTGPSRHPLANQTAFWDFSWHEIGVYDNTAIIDYVLGVTKKRQIFYVGHSQGTTTFLVMASKRPIYNEKIQLAVLLAPSAIQQYTRDYMFSSILYVVVNEFKHYIQNTNLPYLKLPITNIRTVLALFCTKRANLQLCLRILEIMICMQNGYFIPEMVPNIIWSFPDTTSARQYLHYIQTIQTGRFAEYDFGVEKNVELYGAKVPPLYNLKNVKAPVALYYSNNDPITVKRNILALEALLPNVIKSYMIPRLTFNHFDYTLAKDCVDLVFQPILHDIEAVSKHDN